MIPDACYEVETRLDPRKIMSFVTDLGSALVSGSHKIGILTCAVSSGDIDLCVDEYDTKVNVKVYQNKFSAEIEWNKAKKVWYYQRIDPADYDTALRVCELIKLAGLSARVDLTSDVDELYKEDPTSADIQRVIDGVTRRYGRCFIEVPDDELFRFDSIINGEYARDVFRIAKDELQDKIEDGIYSVTMQCKHGKDPEDDVLTEVWSVIVELLK